MIVSALTLQSLIEYDIKLYKYKMFVYSKRTYFFSFLLNKKRLRQIVVIVIHSFTIYIYIYTITYYLYLESIFITENPVKSCQM